MAASMDENTQNLLLGLVLAELSEKPKQSEDDDILPLVALQSELEGECEAVGTARIPDYVEKTVPTYSDPLFRSHFRMTRESVQVKINAVVVHVNIICVAHNIN